ncbi:hypothetical protein HYW17_00840 [Candidatus Uhrbacteria bacterium]|nr:hypothetical protein [Candidatus Uhrbacteria bacterium]
MAATKTPASGTTPQVAPASPASASSPPQGIAGVRERIKQVAAEARTLAELADGIVNDPRMDELGKRGKSFLQLLGFKIE